MLLPSLLKSGDQVYQKVIKQLYQKMLLLNLLITKISNHKLCFLTEITIFLEQDTYFGKDMTKVECNGTHTA